MAGFVGGVIKFAVAIAMVAIGNSLLFLVGDRNGSISLLEKRRDAVFAVVRGVVGLAGGWAIWLAAGQSLWLLVPVIVWPVSLYLIVSGIVDLTLLMTRDRELLRREKATLARDRPLVELASDTARRRELMRQAGMTDDEIQYWAAQRIDRAQIEFDAETEAAEEDYVGRGRLASRYRRPHSPRT
jgi:hypothetical protein